MATDPTLFDLFGEFTSRWPRAVQRLVGILGPGSSDPDLAVWLAALNNGTSVSNLRTGAAGDRVSVEARLNFDNAQAAYAGSPGAWPFVLASMPDVEFRVQTLPPPRFIQLFASVSERGTELVLEGLPVEIRLPAGLIQPPGGGPAEVETGAFTPGTLDHLRIVYRRFGPTSVFVHVRLLMDEENEFVIRPAVPITFSKCLFSEMPVQALHDFGLIPSPGLVSRNNEWIRHTVDPWLPDHTGPLDGLFFCRTTDLDELSAPFKDIAEVLNSSGETVPEAEFVLDDLAVPFFSPYVIPIPRHITTGIRRRILQADSIEQVFSFSTAPVRLFLSCNPSVGFLINSFFYKSLPSEDLSTDLGLTFSAVVFFGKDESGPYGFEISLGENYTPLLGYRRSFSSSTGLPDPETGAKATINAILHWEIATISIDIMGLRAGYSLGRAIGEGKGFGDCFEFTADLFVHMPPAGGDNSFFRMRSLDGQPAKFALEGLGWRQGSFHFEGLALPDGVVIFLGPVKIIIQEFGLVAESGASYLSFSGGLGVDLPSGFSGSLVFRRLRFWVSGEPTAPPFKLDGIIIALRFGSTLRIDAGGFYTERQLNPATVREFGLTGTVAFKLAAVNYLFSLDVLAGSLSSPTEDFDYLMFQVAFRGSVSIAWFELRGVRVLFARNMQPKLLPANNEAHELRYYNWYKATNPINVPGDRRLAAWELRRDSWALGIGLGASLAQLGRIIELSAFVLVVEGNDENGLLVVAEALLLQNPNPIAFLAIQWDGKNDQFSMLIGVNLTPRQFLTNIPAWLNRIARLTGTLFICNKPVVVALGRLSDSRTWFSLIFDFDVWVRFFIQFGVCFEYSEAPGGGKGFGLIVRLEGTINAGIVRVDFNAGFGAMFAVFKTASNDYAAVFFIEAGLRIVLFRFLRFGISVRADFRNVGARPSRGELRAEIRLETPWFLPDVTWTFEATFGQLKPAGLAVAVSACRSAMAISAADQKGQVVHVERIDPSLSGSGVATTFSIDQLRGMSLNEADRLNRFAANADAAPIATDSSLSVEFSVALNDQLGIGGVAPGQGNQKAGDLTLSYDLVEVSVRRRARFGADKNWYPLQQKIELEADFSDPNGVDLNGSFSPQQLTMFWSPDAQIEGRTAAKKLILNSRTPYDFQTSNPEVDEEVVSDNPRWPCCAREKQPFPLHQVRFRNEIPGADILGHRLYSQSQSRFRFLQNAYAFSANFSSVLPPNTLVGLVTSLRPGVLFRADLDEEAGLVFFRLYWSFRTAHLLLLAFDENGDPVGELAVSPQSDFQQVVLPLSGPPRQLEARLQGFAGPEGEIPQILHDEKQAFAIDRAAYIGLRDYLDYLIGLEACDNTSDSFQNGYSGRGALAFLPNYEYEFALRTRVTVRHPSAPDEPADMTEYVYFRTRGLPGLNAVEEVGAEIRPYVHSIYEGGRGTLYREEPVAIVFDEDFHVAVPLALRPPGTSQERNTLLKMKLLVRPDQARDLNTPFTSTGSDWIVDHRGTVIDPIFLPYRVLTSSGATVGTSILSSDPFRGRLAEVTQRPGASCPLSDPRSVVGTALIAPPQGEADPEDPTRELWPSNLPFTASVRLEGAGFVDRSSFLPVDLTALDRATNSSASSAGWSVQDGALVASTGAQRRFAIFGEPDWNHLTIEVSIAQVGTLAGIGVSLPAGNIPSRGLFAVVEPAGPGRRIAIFRRSSGTQFTLAAQAALPAPADPADPTLLTVTAFDDKLRASVGDTVVETDRGELREGRLCLIAQGDCRFGALRVTGLDLYRFPFQTSRFRSFGDHMNSFQGPPDVIEPDSLGPGTTTNTTAALYGATGGQMAAAMQPEADSAVRQELFERWTRELGIPLKDEVDRLEISRFAVSGQTRLLLLESPEALDFSQEIQLRLSRRDRVPFPFPFELAAAAPPPSRKVRIARDRERLLRLEAGASPAATAGLKPTLLDVSPSGEGRIDLNLDLTALKESAPGEKLVIVQALGRGADRRLRVYAASAPAASRGEAMVRARQTDEVKTLGPVSSLVTSKLAKLEEGAFALLRHDLQNIFDIFRPRFVWTALDSNVLQDATGRRALVIPVSGSGALALGPGTYRLRFDLSRNRWETSDPHDDLNRYQRTATLILSF